MSSLLSEEMTTTRTKMRKIKNLFLVGPRRNYPRSSAKSGWMEERVSCFRGIKDTE